MNKKWRHRVPNGSKIILEEEGWVLGSGNEGLRNRPYYIMHYHPNYRGVVSEVCRMYLVESTWCCCGEKLPEAMVATRDMLNYWA